MTTAAVYGILALSLNPVLGGAGMLSMCQLTFAAAGAATMGALGGRIPFLVAVLAAALSAVPLGLLVGAISMRLRGMSFAAASLGLAVAGQVAIGHLALPGFQSTASVALPAPLDSTRGYLLFVLIGFALVSVLVAWLRSSRLGRTWSITQFSERAAAATGISVPGAKLTATAVGAAIAGFGGALMVGQYGFITADAVAPINGLVLLVVAMIAGLGSVAGAWIAGLLFVIIPWLLTSVGLPSDIATILFGLAAVQVLATGGDGIVGQLRALAAKRRRQRGSPAALELALLDALRPSGRRNGPSLSLHVSELTVDFGAVRALDGVTIDIAPGTVTGLLGPNGAGKSTLIDTISGFVLQRSGTVTLDERIDGLSVRSRANAGVRRTFQQSRIPRDLTVAQYLELCSGGAGWTRGHNLGAMGRVRVDELDIPARRIVEVAGAFCVDPRVVLLDEPAAGLSETDSRVLGSAIQQLAARLGTAVLLVEHDVEMVRACCDLVYVLDFGRVIGRGAPAEVLSRPEVVAAYLGEEPHE
ncbi:MAG: ATP-binding cassette domain-containing protein [Pseudolysinimonas sp.]